MKMKKLPLGKQVFRTLIEDNFIYVDKTPYLVELAEGGIPTFLSRPRRFGKSLTVSTFKELFLGSKRLFKNTYAYNNWDFNKTSPVVKLDMSTVSTTSINDMEHSIITLVKTEAEDHNIVINEKDQPQLAFRELIRGLRNSNKVVVLVDEYDSPILNALDSKILPEIKDLLRIFYNVLKEQEENIRFTFITGISKFSKVGVFSTLNNLNDITLNKKFPEICGYTKEEIILNFSNNLKSCKKELNLSEESLWEELKNYYNGYSWNGKNFLFNPFSILSFFENQSFAPYWIESGSPSFLKK